VLGSSSLPSVGARCAARPSHLIEQAQTQTQPLDEECATDGDPIALLDVLRRCDQLTLFEWHSDADSAHYMANCSAAVRELAWASANSSEAERQRMRQCPLPYAFEQWSQLPFPMSDRGQDKDSLYCEPIGKDRLFLHCHYLHDARQRQALRRWIAEREQRRQQLYQRQRLRGESVKEVHALRVRMLPRDLTQAIELTLDNALRLEFGLHLPPRCDDESDAAAAVRAAELSAQAGCTPARTSADGGLSFDLSWCASPLPLLPWFWSVYPLRDEDRGLEPLLSVLRGYRHGRQPDVAAVAQPLVLSALQLTAVDTEMLRQEAKAETRALQLATAAADATAPARA
jgi:hypothetical protein